MRQHFPYSYRGRDECRHRARDLGEDIGHTGAAKERPANDGALGDARADGPRRRSGPRTASGNAAGWCARRRFGPKPCGTLGAGSIVRRVTPRSVAAGQEAGPAPSTVVVIDERPRQCLQPLRPAEDAGRDLGQAVPLLRHHGADGDRRAGNVLSDLGSRPGLRAGRMPEAGAAGLPGGPHHASTIPGSASRRATASGSPSASSSCASASKCAAPTAQASRSARPPSPAHQAR